MQPFMNLRYIAITALITFLSNSVIGQTKAQLDSIKTEFIKNVQKMPPLPDSVIQKHNSIEARRISKLNNPDTLIFAKVKRYNVNAFPFIFETAYYDSTQIKQDTFLLSFYLFDIGRINIESGQIIACDPINMADARPFLQTFPTGKFPLQLSIAKVNNAERIAFSRIYFSDKPVVKWEFALDSGKTQSPIDGETFYGYSVDGGTGLFIDVKANKAFSDVSKTDENLWENVFTGEMNTEKLYGWQYLLYNFQGHNLASFSTGFGDGRYATYVGYDNKGNPCRLLTDFGLVDWWKK